MRVITTPTGGRAFTCDTPYLRARIVDGVVELWEPRTPPEERKRRLKPGSLLATAIHHVTKETGTSTCNCTARMNQMNAWGWWGCWRHRRTIAGWLTEEAAKRGHAIGERQALDLLKAAWRQNPPRPQQVGKALAADRVE